MDLQKSRHNHAIYQIAECVSEAHKISALFHYVFPGVVHNVTNVNIIFKWFSSSF